MPKDRLLFAKEGRARYISHLDLMRTFQRAFTRAQIPIKHTEGFNPHPFISIALPLPLGFSSRCELLEFGLLEGTDYADVPARLNAALPEGVRVLECYPGERSMKELMWLDYELQVDASGDLRGLQTAWSELLSRDSWVVEKPSKKAKSGVTSIDIPTLVKEFTFTDFSENGFILQAVLAAQNPSLNPSFMVSALSGACPWFPVDFVRYGRREILDAEGKIFR